MKPDQLYVAIVTPNETHLEPYVYGIFASEAYAVELFEQQGPENATLKVTRADVIHRPSREAAAVLSPPDHLFNDKLLAPDYPIPQWEEDLPDKTPTVNLTQNDYETLALLYVSSPAAAYQFLAHCLDRCGGTAKQSDMVVGTRIRLVRVGKRN